jgi:hypothetical protein
MGMQGCLDDPMKFVLDIRESDQQTSLVVVVYHGYYSFTFTFHIRHPFVIRDVRTDSVANTLRTGRVPALVDYIIKLVKQVAGK